MGQQGCISEAPTIAPSQPHHTGVLVQDWTSWQVPSVLPRNQDCEQGRIERTKSPITRFWFIILATGIPKFMSVSPQASEPNDEGG